MRLPAGDGPQNERSRQIEKADGGNVKKSRDNYISGALYLRNDAGAWVALSSNAGAGSGDLLAANNLSDLASAATARTHLGLGTAATTAAAAYATEAQGTKADSALQAADLVFSFAQVRNTDTTTDINTASWTNIPFGGTSDATDVDYTLTTTSITVEFDGTVNVQAHIAQSGAVVRSSVGIRITKNGTAVSGVGQSGYIRATGGHDNASSHISATIAVADGDIIRVQGIVRGATGTVTQPTGESQVTIERRT